jgi:hypothetical protein
VRFDRLILCLYKLWRSYSGENIDYLIVRVDGFGVLSIVGSESGLPWQISVPADS